jgi:hypothetical protein
MKRVNFILILAIATLSFGCPANKTENPETSNKDTVKLADSMMPPPPPPIPPPPPVPKIDWKQK